jgi:predicted nucleic acid-binding Zn ribbon protein
VDEHQPNEQPASDLVAPVAPGAAGEDDESHDIAHQALNQAQRFTKSSPRRTKRRRSAKEGAPRGYSGPGPDDRDPQMVAGLLEGLVEAHGWQRQLAHARVFADWANLVGADNAAHCEPVSLNDGELRVTAESTAWATQLQMMSSALLASLVRELGPDVVRRIYITGPTGPSWKHGGWSVRGARGPRDTYG